jgi:hypothetical protein
LPVELGIDSRESTAETMVIGNVGGSRVKLSQSLRERTVTRSFPDISNVSLFVTMAALGLPRGTQGIQLVYWYQVPSAVGRRVSKQGT